MFKRLSDFSHLHRFHPPLHAEFRRDLGTLEQRAFILNSEVSKHASGDNDMNSLAQLLEIASRIDHLGSCAEWIARETCHTDNSVSQTGTLISVLAEDLREKITNLVSELEQMGEIGGSH